MRPHIHLLRRDAGLSASVVCVILLLAGVTAALLLYKM